MRVRRLRGAQRADFGRPSETRERFLELPMSGLVHVDELHGESAFPHVERFRVDNDALIFGEVKLDGHPLRRDRCSVAQHEATAHAEVVDDKRNPQHTSPLGSERARDAGAPATPDGHIVIVAHGFLPFPNGLLDSATCNNVSVCDRCS
jgi:hypothetical protein